MRPSSPFAGVQGAASFFESAKRERGSCLPRTTHQTKLTFVNCKVQLIGCNGSMADDIQPKDDVDIKTVSGTTCSLVFMVVFFFFGS